MKKTLALFLVFVFCLSFVSCSNASSAQVAEEPSSDEEIADESSLEQEEATVDNSDIDIVLVVPNTLGDKAFSDMVWGGITLAKETYGLGNIKCIELRIRNLSFMILSLTTQMVHFKMLYPMRLCRMRARSLLVPLRLL